MKPGTWPAPTPGDYAPPPMPAHVRADRDRLVVHLVWEALLALITLVIVVVLLTGDPAGSLTQLFAQAAPLGLAATAVAFSLRTGTPNLAVGPLAGVTGALAASLAEQDMPLVAAMATGVSVATAAGLVLGLITAALSVPAWAVTLAGGAVAQAIVFGATDANGVILQDGGSGSTAVWFAVFVVVSIGGALAWLLPGVRTQLSATRQPAIPGRWAGLRPGLGALAGLTGSSFLAGLAGVVLLLRLRGFFPTDYDYLTLAGVGAALLGGVSIFGRRAGIAGTVLGVTFFASAQMILIIQGAEGWVVSLVAGLLLIDGLGVSRALEGITNAFDRDRHVRVLTSR